MTLYWIVLSIVGLVTVADLILLLALFFNFKNYPVKSSEYPSVSVLVAARNEEKNIERCVRSLIELDYPSDQLEILIGDDQSTDMTWEILRKLCEEEDHVNIYQVNRQLGIAQGKPNVLAHLAKKAKGDIYFITDADCAVHKNWIQALLGARKENVGIVIGTTSVESSWQNMHWLLALGMVKSVTDLGMPLTAMGNNMYVTKEAYDAVGGYESIPFSVTEDYELFRQVAARGFVLHHVVTPAALAISRPARTLRQLLHQRKRWMKGAVQLPISTLLLLFVQALYYPALLILFFINWRYALPVFILKSLLQSLFLLIMVRKLSSTLNWLHLIFFDIYLGLISSLSSIFYILPVKIQWKGRKY
ncbi:glycosyltransferase [Fulvivirga sp. M361]|uniref:glycosyltransferase n=1 Tax=Fulvivirga sp. M361 TaxID=2594266 RepID=UPI00117A693A|nr:glycosyltransferase [Fulvivirga sp. M361]TRX62131.1 glycosyltransferase [Fulvivirga sp. M361]